MGRTNPLHRGQEGDKGHRPKLGALGGGGGSVGGGGGPPAASGRGGGLRGGQPCSHPSARQSAARATSCTRSRWGLGGTRRRTSSHWAVAQTSPGSGRVAHQTLVSRERRACTSAATSR